MALGAADEQPAGRHHLLAVLLDLALELGQHLASAALVLLARSSGFEALARELLAGEVLGVAAELDVDATAGHVGGDRDGARLAGLGDDLGLARGVLGLGVQHRVRDAELGQALRPSSSETSTEIVPTSTGWPFSWRALISLTTALHLPSLVL